MITYIPLISLTILASTLVFYGIAETIAVIKGIQEEKFIHGNVKHSVEHLLIIPFYLISYVGFFCWLFLHGGIENAIEKCLFDQGLMYILIFQTLAGLFLVYHLSKERKDKRF